MQRFDPRNHGMIQAYLSPSMTCFCFFWKVVFVGLSGKSIVDDMLGPPPPWFTVDKSIFEGTNTNLHFLTFHYYTGGGHCRWFNFASLTTERSPERPKEAKPTVVTTWIWNITCLYLCIYYQLRPKHTCGGCFLCTKKTYDYTVSKISVSLYNANYMKYVMYRPKWCMIEQMQQKYIPIGSLVGNDIWPPTTITQLWAQPSGVGLQQKRSWSPRHLNVCLWSTWRSQICICGWLILRWCDMYTAVYIRLPFFNAPKMIFRHFGGI